MRRWREHSPLKAAFATLRNNAKRRGIEFTLSLPDFALFCEQTNYLALKGLGPDDMTIDRINNYKGYEAGNIQMLTRRENSKQGRKGKPEYKHDPTVPF